MSKMQVEERPHLLIDLRIGNDQKALENLFEANMENAAITSENNRLKKDNKVQQDIYGVQYQNIQDEFAYQSHHMAERPDEIGIGKMGDVARDVTAGNIKSRKELSDRTGLGGYIAPKRELIDAESGQIFNKADQ